MVGARMRIGNRLYATLDRVRGFYPRKLTLPLTSTVRGWQRRAFRLVGANAGDKINGLGGEKAVAARSAGGLATAFTPRSTGPAASIRASSLCPPVRVDDDLTASLASRLVGAGIGQMLKPLAPQAGGTIRIRWGNRLLGQYTKAGGMMWARQTLPTDCKMADQPTNLSIVWAEAIGRRRSMPISWRWLPLASGKTQITTRRRSTGALVPITPASATTSYRAPS
jgi:hypothetical protein